MDDGAHDVLLERCATYRTLVGHQLGADVTAGEASPSTPPNRRLTGA